MVFGDGFVLLAVVIVWIYGFIDALFAAADRVRLMPKAVWVILILIFGVFAAVPWFIWGRPRSTPSATGGRPGFTTRRSAANGSPPRPAGGGWQLGGAPPGRRSGPVAPDDDPEFLRQLGRKPRDEPGSGDPNPAG